MRAQWLLMPLLLALQACSGTTFGQKLADSFDSPPTPAAAQQTPNSKLKQEPDSALKEPAKAEGEGVQDKTTSDSDAEPTDPSEPQTPKQALTNVQPAKKESATIRSQPAAPRPYRITIRLAAADPAAPAESVTDALRRAGIGFEVETIEKIPSLQVSKEATNDSERQP
ncbi:hypothetical protein OAK25_01720 [Synechococcus sp. AH-551-P10]|nr:hypothetical protein [Synechococcus sp. AH-603-L18]MDC0256853.1 hypothetical protein [Synechococcus sp. AH-551-P10]|tara:strand:- start:1209 stop:1715 length:507 start_codon:yes stop_codon:yes gene_type:complete